MQCLFFLGGGHFFYQKGPLFDIIVINLKTLLTPFMITRLATHNESEKKKKKKKSIAHLKSDGTYPFDTECI